MNIQRRGFTLVELILYCAMAALLVVTMTIFLATLTDARLKAESIAEVEQQGTQIIQLVTQSLRNATAVNSPTIGTSAASLSITTTVGANNPTIFDVTSGTMRITQGAGTPTALTNPKVTVSGLTFQNLSRASTPAIIRVQFTLTRVNTSARNEFSYAKTFTASARLKK